MGASIADKINQWIDTPNAEELCDRKVIRSSVVALLWLFFVFLLRC